MTMNPVWGPLLDESEFALAQSVASGNLNAFEQIMRRHNRMLYRAARAILRDDAEAEDCLQSAYLLAYQSIRTFAGQAKLSTWLARIVINEALGRKRRTARNATVIPFDSVADTEAMNDLCAPATGTPNPEAEAMRHELGALLERRIDGLPEAFRGVFVLRALEELSVEETAALLDIPEATVRTRYFRARSMLRESLAREVDAALHQAFKFDGARCDRTVTIVLARLRFAASPGTTG
jgi:RNA polymerase sigma-70 factor (ECF subfamily)